MKALYRKYRSQSLTDVVGQAQVTDILTAALKRQQIGHGYLFVGPRGVGKTSVARILAHEINQIDYQLERNHIDIIEIDAASNTGVDNIRELIEKANVMPVETAYKVYIIDEVHMLSKAAFNAFLKLLEEPPHHVVFILATTDLYKVPETIVSRTQKFIFRRITDDDIAKRLGWIVEQENAELSPEILALIARFSRGGLRDAINALEQILSLAEIDKQLSLERVEQLLGLVSQLKLEQILDNFLSGDLAANIQILDQLTIDNYEPSEISRQLARLIQTRLARDPSLIGLLEQLLLVEKSSLPGTQLLLALASNYNNSTNATTPTSKPQKPTAKTPAKSTQKTATTKPKQSKSKKLEDAKPKSAAKTEAKLNLDKLLQEAQANYKLLFPILSRSTLAAADGVLKIQVRQAFDQKNLAKQNLQMQIQKLIQNQTDAAFEISVKFQPEEDKLAAVKDLMGGGEEVNYNE